MRNDDLDRNDFDHACALMRGPAAVGDWLSDWFTHEDGSDAATGPEGDGDDDDDDDDDDDGDDDDDDDDDDAGAA